MKDAYWFSHDSNARHDAKIIKLKVRFQNRGYAIYFQLIEMLREANAYQLPCNWEMLAYELREPETDIQEVVQCFELFEFDSEKFYSRSLLERMKHLDKIKEKRKKSGKLGGLAKAKQMLSTSLAKGVANSSYESKVKESKGKEIKEKKREDKDPSPPAPVINSDKIKYLTYVYLTPEQHKAWTDKVGPEMLQAAITKLDGWIGSDPTPKRIKNGKNASACFQSWVMNAVGEDKLKAMRLQPFNGPQQSKQQFNDQLDRIFNGDKNGRLPHSENVGLPKRTLP